MWIRLLSIMSFVQTAEQKKHTITILERRILWEDQEYVLAVSGETKEMVCFGSMTAGTIFT